MRKAVIVALMSLCIFQWITPFVHGQTERFQEKENAFYESVKYLRQNIEKGWTPEMVLEVIGQPDSIQLNTQGNYEIEIWGYRGYEIRIEFRNGVVDNWFIRFMP